MPIPVGQCVEAGRKSDLLGMRPEIQVDSKALRTLCETIEEPDPDLFCKALLSTCTVIWHLHYSGKILRRTLQFQMEVIESIRTSIARSLEFYGYCHMEGSKSDVEIRMDGLETHAVAMVQRLAPKTQWRTTGYAPTIEELTVWA